MSARAIVSRRRIPPDRSSTWRIGALRELGELEQLVGALADLTRGEPEVAAVDDQVVADGQLGVEACRPAGTTPSRGRISRAVASRGRGRGRAASPAADGATCSAIIRIVEVLPAPFGPRKPNDLAAPDLEVDPVDGAKGRRAVPCWIRLREAPSLDQEPD